MAIILSFDIGYASIGWCVLSSEKSAEPDFLGTGVVTFPTDDCLASTRRDLRRTRRHIRSTRQRIERLKRWLQDRGVLSREDLDKPGHPAPFLLAAAALQGHKTLTAWELWTVLRWYAHNRGYDGNSRWSREEITEEDSKKEIAARSLMDQHGTETMCETICACLGLKPEKHNKTISSQLPYRTLDAAYPRRIVEQEVRSLISPLVGKLPGLDAETTRLILKGESLSEEERKTIATAGIKLPKRYHGGLLFGQLVPRFDNRIISRCPITWAKEYDVAISSGKSEAEASKLAEKLAKVPAAKCPEFLRYRFARILANLRADGDPISKELRAHLLALAEKQGRLSHADLEREIKAALGAVPTNIDTYFKLHPDSEEALVLDPVADLVRKSEGSQAKLSAVWKLLPEAAKGTIIAQWLKHRAVSFAFILQTADNDPAVLAAFERKHAEVKPKKNQPVPDFDNWLIRTSVGPEIPSGRAPYARPVLRQVVAEVLAGFDPTRSAADDADSQGRKKEKDGILYSLLDPTSRVRQLQAERPLDKLTNNHLVRHRLLILDRLITDLLAEFPALSESGTRVVVEVGRELKEFSGKTAKEIAAELNSRLKDFKSAVAHLEKFAPELKLNGSLIRKCRIAMDLGWKCPFTGDEYDAYALPRLEREHIIPYATRNTNALHALVLTWPEINRWKKKRTAHQFILDEQGKPVPGRPNLSLFTLKQYEAFVAALDTKGHLDDYRRKKARKDLLLVTSYEDKDLGFTEGAMTQTSHLMKLAMRGIRQTLPAASCDPVPGAVTGEIRKSWDLLGTLARACPEVIGPDEKVLPKNDIRGITHLHHALDAATLALALHYFPLTRYGENQSGLLWQAMLKRGKSAEEISLLLRTGRYKPTQRPGKDGGPSRPDAEMLDLPPEVKEKLSRSLAQSRVMQHIPADRSGTKAELTTWGILAIVDDYALIIQRPNRGLLEQDPDSTQRRWKDKPPTKEATKLLQEHGELIGAKERRLVERGIHKLSTEKLTKLLGPSSPKDGGKLAAIRGALVIGDNFAIALDPSPTLIPFHQVHKILTTLTASNRGKFPRLIRIGTAIKVATGTWKGTWRVVSVKNSQAYGISVDLALPGGGKMAKGNAKVPQMLLDGLEILPSRYTGYSISG